MACKDGDMDSRTLLIFDLDGELFALDPAGVRESIWLPELTAAEEAPPWVVGLFSLRGRIVPVADLRLRLGHPSRSYTLSDQVVVLEAGQFEMGLIVSEIRGVVELPSSAIHPPPRFDNETTGMAYLVTGEARVGEELVTLLDIARLFHPSEGPVPGATIEHPAPGYFCPEATPTERARFHARALVLREAVAEEGSELMGLAVVRLGDEYFAVELAAVQEFHAIGQLSPIPCCPPHILGAMSLRGELITLLDPRAALNLPPAAMGTKAVVARIAGQAIGIAVDEVEDLLYLRAEQLQPPPAAVRERSGMEVMGTARYADRMLTVLDLPALLGREEWIVNENV
jgi:purine-binding chemotaxis protein CheW